MARLPGGTRVFLPFDPNAAPGGAVAKLTERVDTIEAELHSIRERFGEMHRELQELSKALGSFLRSAKGGRT